MKLMKRNLRPFWYCLVAEEGTITDGDGFVTGEGSVLYTDPVEIKGSINPAEGRIYAEEFGLREDYDKLIIVEDMDCPIKEDSVLFIDSPPEYDEHGNLTNSFDYIVQRVAPALNHFKIIARKVITS